MRINKEEAFSIMPMLIRLNSPLINTNRIDREYLGSSHVAQYLPKNTEGVCLKEIVKVQQLIEGLSEEDLARVAAITMATIESTARKSRLKEQKNSLILLALLKSGLRVGYQHNTKLLIDNISIPYSNNHTEKLGKILTWKLDNE